MMYLVYAKRDFSTFKKGDILNRTHTLEGAEKWVKMTPDDRGLEIFDSSVKYKKGMTIHDVRALSARGEVEV